MDSVFWNKQLWNVGTVISIVAAVLSSPVLCLVSSDKMWRMVSKQGLSTY